MAMLFVQTGSASVHAAGIKKLYTNTYNFLAIFLSNNNFKLIENSLSWCHKIIHRFFSLRLTVINNSQSKVYG